MLLFRGADGNYGGNRQQEAAKNIVRRIHRSWGAAPLFAHCRSRTIRDRARTGSVAMPGRCGKSERVVGGRSHGLRKKGRSERQGSELAGMEAIAGGRGSADRASA